MPSVLVAVPAVAVGLQLEDALRRAGAEVRWEATLADGPVDHALPRDLRGQPPAVVIVDADHLADQLPAVVTAWRASAALPGVVAIGDGEAARQLAPTARVTLLATKASAATVTNAVRHAYRLRHAGALSWPMLCAAVAQPAEPFDAAAVSAAAVAARGVALELPQAALAGYDLHYVTATAMMRAILDERALALPEQGAAAGCDGTLTLASALRRGPLDPAAALRLLWALGCAGAVDFTAEPRDVDTPERRALAEIRRHLATRKQRLPGGTYYDVLEVTPLAEAPQIEEAYRVQALRYAPAAVASFDLGELAASVQPMWDLVEKARTTLLNPAARGRYHDWLQQKRELHTVWAIEPKAATLAMQAFTRGQNALGEGDVHRAVGELAAACRAQPGHPELEATLAWARYRVQVAAGHDRDALARVERAALEERLTGGRPWPRALVALALLCAACGDLEAARWHLQQALLVDPAMPAARQLQRRLMRQPA